MLEHHIQQQIIRRALQHEHSRYRDLQPPDTEGNLFSYHLQQLIKAKYIQKNEDGTYILTELGLQLAPVSHLRGSHALSQAHSVLLLAVRNGDQWLVRERLVQPNLGLTGFVHGEPESKEPVTVTARNRLLQKTGLTADFTVTASGLVRIFRGETLESFSHCILLYTENASGKLIERDETGINKWVSTDIFASTPFLPSMPLLRDIVLGSNTNSFFDETYILEVA